VYDAYAANAPLTAALHRGAKHKAALTLQPVEVVARHRPDLDAGTPWRVGTGRFLVVVLTSSSHRLAGTVRGA
jgi:hypothetical protein